MIKVSDFIFEYLFNQYGIDTVFLVTGGGAMHLNDSIGRNKNLRYICNHHEQASAMAAEGYYRASGKLCVTNVTTGPGATNAITGVLGQWCDSIPALYISGQVKLSTTMLSYPHINLRQLGDQEVNIVEIVKPITKYSVTITDPLDIKFLLDKCVHTALSGRSGPVWLDIPLDIQGASVDEVLLKDFRPKQELVSYLESEEREQIDEIFNKIKTSHSPVIYVGNGVRLSGATEAFMQLIQELKIPVVTAISGSDLLWEDHPLYYGRPGICGDRIGNIMVQNSDLLIILGTRLSIRQVGYAYDLWAPKAFKVMVDIDKAEMDKPTLNINLKIKMDLSAFVGEMIRQIGKYSLPDFSEWRLWGRECLKILPTILEDNPELDGFVNSYVFAKELFGALKVHDVVVTGNGTAYTSTFQAMQIKKGVRVFANQGCAAMGYDLPAAIGAILGNVKGRTILITGDGSIQMNIQELQTLCTYKLPLKIFVLENQGYLAIKTTQMSFFEGHFMGSNPDSGVVCVSMESISKAYGIPFVRIVNDGDELRQGINNVLNYDGSIICEIKMNPLQTLYPKAASYLDGNGKMQSAPLEKMAPFMPQQLQEKCVYKPSKIK